MPEIVGAITREELEDKTYHELCKIANQVFKIPYSKVSKMPGTAIIDLIMAQGKKATRDLLEKISRKCLEDLYRERMGASVATARNTSAADMIEKLDGVELSEEAAVELLENARGRISRRKLAELREWISKVAPGVRLHLAERCKIKVHFMSAPMWPEELQVFMDLIMERFPQALPSRKTHLTNFEKIALAEIKKRGPIKAAEISTDEMTKYSYAGVCGSLVRKKLIERLPDGRYRIKED